MVRAFLRFHGAAQVGFAQLETDTTEKLIYAYDTGSGAAQGPRIDILDVDQPEDHPADAKTGTTWLVLETPDEEQYPAEIALLRKLRR